MSSKDNLTRLSETDLWSLVLFALFKMSDLPEFSSLSELVYILPKESMIKLCQYYGGMTITIPTLDELETLLYTLLLYKMVNIDNIGYKEALKSLSLSQRVETLIESKYNRMCTILNKYEFKPRSN